MEHAVWQTEGGLDFSLFLTLQLDALPHTVRGAAFSQASQNSVLLGLKVPLYISGHGQCCWSLAISFSHLQLQYSALCIN